jgi:hypothetical protein
MQLLEDGVPLVPPAGQTYRLRLYVRARPEVGSRLQKPEADL